MKLRQALHNIHRDPSWWRKTLIGGALTMSIIGIPWSAGYLVESLDNNRKGFASPLPPWIDWGTKYITGLFALLIDLVFFILPLLIIGMVGVCFGISLITSQTQIGASLIGSSFAVITLFIPFLMFSLSVAPIGRLLFIREGQIEHALSNTTLRRALQPTSRSSYLRARLSSIPGYLPAIIVFLINWQLAKLSLPGNGIIFLLTSWLFCSTLFYAQLVVMQLFAAVDRQIDHTTW